jgi:hypothetical protein
VDLRQWIFCSLAALATLVGSAGSADAALARAHSFPGNPNLYPPVMPAGVYSFDGDFFLGCIAALSWAAYEKRHDSAKKRG